MDKDTARETLTQLAAYTKAICKFVGTSYEQKGRNHYGPFKDGKPFGAINHYTASNAAASKDKPYGRIPVLLERFARGGKQGVGIHFIVWDYRIPRFDEMRDRYPLIKDIPSEIFFFGDDLAFWHAGWVNRWSYGIEIRNCGQLVHKNGVYFWSSGQHRYEGREPIKIGNSWWEPYTRSQMGSTLLIHRWMSALHDIRPEWFLGHVHVSNTRVDPGPHFPIHEMREFGLTQTEVPLSSVAFLKEFVDDNMIREETFVSEDSLHKGLYRNDWDGVDPDFDPEAVDYGGMDETDPATIQQVKRDMRSIGYHPGPKDTVDIDSQFQDTLRAFQGRWKVRNARGAFVNELPITGKLDDVTLKKLKMMVSMYDRM